MKADYLAVNDVDEQGVPNGGYASGMGMGLVWQKGPLGRGNDRKQPNGAFVETVIDAVIQRIEFYQGSKFNCAENEAALGYLRRAAEALASRTAKREAQAVEGTHAVHA